MEERLEKTLARVIDWLRPYGFILLYALILTGILGDVVYPIQQEISRWLV